MRLLAIIALAGAASVTTLLSDANDVSGRLDLRSAKAVTASDTLSMEITAWGTWSSKALRANSKNRFTILYDVNNDRVADFTGRLVYGGGKLTLRLSGRGNSYEALPTRRPTPQSVSFVHPVDIMLPKPTQRRMQIAVVTKFVAKGACKRACRDRMPNAPQWAVVVFPVPRQQ
ncbi:MAG: hypothetical protein M3R70_02265 [Actinomycetota bacterium]|nr:hypothetical protein [Actinomycetota bacterium]